VDGPGDLNGTPVFATLVAMSGTRIDAARACMRWLALFSLPAMIAGAQTLNPASYSMSNGKLGAAGLLYRDDLYRGSGDSKQDGAPLSGGLGQLSDGATGCADDPATDRGSGAGFEWVGWREDPTITITFGQRCDFKSARIYTANWPDASVRLWKTATVSVSDDGFSFRDFVIRTATPEEEQDRKARYVSVPLRGSGQFVRIHLIRGDPNAWLLISEIRFEGQVSRDQAPPSKPR
jgi:hypothetical protein